MTQLCIWNYANVVNSAVIGFSFQKTSGFVEVAIAKAICSAIVGVTVYSTRKKWLLENCGLIVTKSVYL